jgi:hypothetical protein
MTNKKGNSCRKVGGQFAPKNSKFLLQNFTKPRVLNIPHHFFLQDI